jgi:FkbM family methyltransferase
LAGREGVDVDSRDNVEAFDEALQLSYAQNGEDIVLSRGLTAADGFYVDIGAYDPAVESVTKLFYDRGWRGINVDPVAEIIETFERDRARDINVCAAISRSSGQAQFFTGPPELLGHSTLESQIAQKHTADGSTFRSSTVRTMRLDELLDTYVPPETTVDFLKVDVEGHEQAVLESCDWSTWRPRVVVVECLAPYVDGSTHESWEQLLLAADYRFVLFDGLNRFYVEAAEKELCERLGAPASIIDEFEKIGVREMRRYLHHVEIAFNNAESELRSLREHVAWLEQRLVEAGEAQLEAQRTIRG